METDGLTSSTAISSRSLADAAVIEGLVDHVVEGLVAVVVIPPEVHGQEGCTLPRLCGDRCRCAVLPEVDRHGARIESPERAPFHGEMEEPEVPRLVSPQPVSHHIDEEGVSAENDVVAREILRPPRCRAAEEIVPVLAVERVGAAASRAAVAPENAVDDVERAGGRGDVVDGPVRPDFHPLTAEHARAVPAGDDALPDVTLVVFLYGFFRVPRLGIGPPAPEDTRIAELLVVVGHGALEVLAAERHSHRVRLELRDIEHPGVVRVDRFEVGNLPVRDAVGNLRPVVVAALLEAPADLGRKVEPQIRPHAPRHVHETVGGEGFRAVHLAHMELVSLDPELLHAFEHALDEEGVGPGAENVLDRDALSPPVRRGLEIRLHRYRGRHGNAVFHMGLVHALPEGETRPELPLGVVPFIDRCPHDEDGFRVPPDEGVNVETSARGPRRRPYRGHHPGAPDERRFQELSSVLHDCLRASRSSHSIEK